VRRSGVGCLLAHRMNAERSGSLGPPNLSATRAPLGEPLRGHQGGVSSVAFAPDGSRFASSGWDGMVRLWPVYTSRVMLMGAVGLPRVSGHL